MVAKAVNILSKNCLRFYNSKYCQKALSRVPEGEKRVSCLWNLSLKGFNVHGKYKDDWYGCDEDCSYTDWH